MIITILYRLCAISGLSLAFTMAYALTRSKMPFKAFFKVVAMVPILVPSLLRGIASVYLFGRQGFLNWLLFGHNIYGPIGIVISEVFFYPAARTDYPDHRVLNLGRAPVRSCPGT